MVEDSRPRRPDLVPYVNFPQWWHPAGAKVQLVQETDPNEMLLASKVAKLEIKKITHPYQGDVWKVDWAMFHNDVSGTVMMSDKIFAQAFGISDHMLNDEDVVLQKYGGTTGLQACFIRYGPYLNIPGPGTGFDGDPNISIFLDTQMILRAYDMLGDVSQHPADSVRFLFREHRREKFFIVKPIDSTS